MKKALLLPPLFFLWSCAPAPEPAKTVDATAEFRPLVEKVLAGWSSLDTKNVAPFYAKDAGLAFYDVMPLKYSGWAEYEAGFHKVSADWKSLKLTLNPDLQVWRNGNIAWATCTVAFQIEPKQGSVMKGDARTTDVLEKRGNDWVIIHEHVSAPMAEAPPAPAPASKK